MYRVLLTEWRIRYYNGGRAPAMATLKKRIDAGIIPGENKTGDYIVFCDGDYTPIQPTPDQPKSAIAARILSKHNASWS